MTAPAITLPVRHDDFGNELVSGDPHAGRHIIRSQWTGRLIWVCAEWQTGRHNTWWVFDEDEMRPICSRCWPLAQGRR